MTNTMSVAEEVEEIGYQLERFHSVFYKIFTIATIAETRQIPTAGVGWDKKSNTVSLYINPDFWKTRNKYNKKFILCHEMDHLLLMHPQRTNKLDREKANKAQDVCINEMLVSSFGFDRHKIQDEKSLCWLDTIPWDIPKIEPEREFEYYYNHMKGQGGDGQTVDDHSKWGNLSDEDAKAIQKAVGDALSEMEPEELENFREKINEKSEDAKAGTQQLDKILNVVRHRRNQGRFRQIFKHWILEVEEEADQWLSPNRRFACVQNTSFILPSPKDKDEKRKKGDIWLFLDTSGSCEHLSQDFFDSANSIPRAHFNVRMFGFSTQVYEIKNNQLKDFGGTSFSCIEDFLRQEPQYPSAVFVITDGQGNNVNPKYPDRWYWFLSENYTHHIPAKSHKFHLKDLKPIP